MEDTMSEEKFTLEEAHTQFAKKLNGETWNLLGKVRDTGPWNGNPPALTELADGRLCCVFGERATCRIIVKTTLCCSPAPLCGKCWAKALHHRQNSPVLRWQKYCLTITSPSISSSRSRPVVVYRAGIPTENQSPQRAAFACRCPVALQ